MSATVDNPVSAAGRAKPFVQEEKRDAEEQKALDTISGKVPTPAVSQSSSRDPSAVATQWLSAFDDALQSGDLQQIPQLFAEECFWRDIIAFTWNIFTSEGQSSIREMLDANLSRVQPSNWTLKEPASEDDGVIQAFIKFETAEAWGEGFLRLKDGKCWTLLTTMTDLKGYEVKRGRNRPFGTVHGYTRGKSYNWLEQKQREEATLGYEKQPYVLVIGAGQAGISLGARLKHLDVPTIIVEKHPRAGDQWRSRYKSLALHDPVWYDHLPYLPFPDTWPVFSPKDKIGDWLECYAKIFELNIWTSTTFKQARYDDANSEWVCDVIRGDGSLVQLRPKQLVFATGMSGVPTMPKVKGMEKFQGIQHHSSKHPSGEAFKGQKVVVIGSNNSAHDIASDLWINEADVTMVQRTSTHIARSDTLMELGLGGLYSENALEKGIDCHKGDVIFASIPFRIMASFQIPLYKEMQRRDAEFYKRLERAGFMLDFGDDESGVFMKYLRRGSGYYFDVGASELVINGDIKLKRGQVTEVKEHSVVLDNGTEIEADVIVWATGYGSMSNWVSQLIGPDVGKRLGKVWGYGSETTKDPGPWEGEERNIWKPTNVEGLWMMGGNLAQARYYSLPVALQLKARMEGIPTPVYKLAPVHHSD